jgi:uncharacterized membrane protein
MSVEQAANQPVETHAPARLTLRAVSLILIALGILVTGYLSIAELTNTTTACIESGAFNCDVVQNSVYSKIMGIPIAVLGFGTYVVLGALVALENRLSFLQAYGVALVFAITLFGFLYSAWLTYIEFFQLKALCPWCLASAAIMTLLFIVSGLRLRQTLLD